MAPHLPPLPYRKVDRLLRKHGFRAVRQAGSHVRYQHPDGRDTTVPCHPGDTIPPGLLRHILKQAGIDPNELR